MAYFDTPQAAQLRSASQSQIQNNFAQIQTLFSVDHENFDSANGEGKHKQATFPVQVIGNCNPGEIRMFGNTSTYTGNPELFIIRSAGPAQEITSANRSATGYSTLSSGLFIKWGIDTINVTTGGPFTFTWPVGGNNIPFTAQLFAYAAVAAISNPGQDVNVVAQVTDYSDETKIVYNTWRRNQFNTPGSDHPPYDVMFFAIGSQ